MWGCRQITVCTQCVEQGALSGICHAHDDDIAPVAVAIDRMRDFLDGMVERMMRRFCEMLAEDDALHPNAFFLQTAQDELSQLFIRQRLRQQIALGPDQHDVLSRQVTGNARQQICLKIKEIDDPQDERILLCDLGKDLGRIDPLLHRDHHIIVMSDAKTALAERCIRLWCISQRISIFRLQSGTAAFTILCHHSSPVSAFPASPAGKRSSVQRLG